MSIRIKLAVIIVFVVILSTGALSYFFVEQEKEVLLKKTIQLCRSNTMALSNIAQDNLLINIRAPIQEFITRLMEFKIEGLKSASVINNDGTIVANSTLDKIDSKLNPAELKEFRNTTAFTPIESRSPGGSVLIEFINPVWISHEGRQTRVGTIVMKFSKDEIFSSIEQAKRLIVTTTLGVIIIALILVITTAHVVTRPVLKLSKAAKNVAEGDLETQVTITSHDELGRLANDFNDMTKNLKLARDQMVVKTRMEQELKTARLVQDTLFPKNDLSLKSIDLSGFFQPASETGGDWFSYFEDEENKMVSVFIGDVSGHGAPAALVAATANSMVSYLKEKKDLLNIVQKVSKISPRALSPDLKDILNSMKNGAINPLSPAGILADLNNIIFNLSSGAASGLMMTFFISSFSSESKELVFANAGHNYPLFISKDTSSDSSTNSKVKTLTTNRGMRLGESKDVYFDEDQMKFHPSDTLLWFTDGLIECVNSNNEPFGKKRLRAVLQQGQHLSAARLKKKIVDDVMGYIGEVPLIDDLTFVVGKVK